MKSSNPEIIPIEAVQERDIDLLILEEIKCNPNFQDWILSKSIGKLDKYDFLGAWHSLSQVGLGESDLALKIKTEDKVVLFLLENKINALFQQDQALRYRQRGKQRLQNGECNEFHTILVAPENYMTRNEDFDFYIAYEEIREWFLNQLDLGTRGAYKAEVLEIAIKKLRRGYTAIADSNATNFWLAYINLVKERYPHLNIKTPPTGKPAGSYFFPFLPKNIGLNKNIQFYHKGNGTVDLQFNGQAENIDALREKFNDSLHSGMKLSVTGKSVCLRLEVESIDVGQDFNSQIDAIHAALEKADLLYCWAKENLTD